MLAPSFNCQEIFLNREKNYQLVFCQWKASNPQLKMDPRQRGSRVSKRSVDLFFVDFRSRTWDRRIASIWLRNGMGPSLHSRICFGNHPGKQREESCQNFNRILNSQPSIPVKNDDALTCVHSRDHSCSHLRKFSFHRKFKQVQNVRQEGLEWIKGP